MVMPRVFQHFGGRVKVAKITTDGITHTATMQAGFSGTFQWQIDTGAGFTDVAGATGTVFTPSPTLADGVLVRVVVDSLTYASEACTARALNTPPAITQSYVNGIVFSSGAPVVFADGSSINFTGV